MQPLALARAEHVVGLALEGREDGLGHGLETPRLSGQVYARRAAIVRVLAALDQTIPLA